MVKWGEGGSAKSDKKGKVKENLKSLFVCFLWRGGSLVGEDEFKYGNE